MFSAYSLQPKGSTLMRRPLSTLRRCAIGILLAAALPGCLVTPTTGDIAIVGGRVMDPASDTDAVLNVLIRGDRVVALTPRAVSAERVIDASGLVVAPGFIDLLARIIPDHEPQRYKIKDGVTTVISMHGGPVDVEAYRQAFDSAGALVNYGATVGHGNVRRAAGVTDRYRAATDEALSEMRQIATEAIQAGAVGVGFGINYVPGASYPEVVAMFDVAARHGTPGHVHSRHKGSIHPETITHSVGEIIAAAAITGASAQIVHLASSGVGSMKESLEMIAGARRHGVDIMADIYPWEANSTSLQSALYDEGWQERFGGATYSDIMLVENGERLNAETFKYWRQEGARIITFFIPNEEIVMALKHPLVMIGSDGIIVDGKGHPRGAGSFARVLGHYTRDEGHISLMTALSKMTVMPARRLEQAVPSMRDRGRLALGSYADITVFDPDSIINRATYLQPDQYSAGVHYVLVNGTVVLDRGEFVAGATPGRQIRHVCPTE